MNCESCGAVIIKDTRIVGQYHKVCFDCWDKGNFKTKDELIIRNFKTYQCTKTKRGSLQVTNDWLEHMSDDQTHTGLMARFSLTELPKGVDSTDERVIKLLKEIRADIKSKTPVLNANISETLQKWIDKHNKAFSDWEAAENGSIKKTKLLKRIHRYYDTITTIAIGAKISLKDIQAQLNYYGGKNVKQ